MALLRNDMKYRLENKTVVLTGASSGIGKEIATVLVTKYSCRVYGIARRESLLLELRDSLGDNFIPCAFDATDRGKWQDLANQLKSEDVTVDTLINCAGVLPKFSSVENSTSEQVLKAMSINFNAQIYATEALLPSIKKSTQGAVISFSSSSALCPFVGVSAYCASKSASRAYFECFARENKKLYVASVMNGFAKTDIMREQSIGKKEMRLISKVSASPQKTVARILRKIKKRKSRIIVGADAHLMNFAYKLFPNLAPKIITKILKGSGLEIFNEI